MRHPLQSLVRAATLTTLAVLTGACSDGLTSPRASAGAAHADVSAASGQPTLIPAHIKYREQGAKPSTGRSGSSTLTVRALLGKDGATELDVATGTVNAGAAAPALAHVQVKQFNTDGGLIRTLNDRRRGGTSAVYTFPGLMRGAAVQVQANVREPSRTAVVTVAGTIHLRPDLRAALHVPQEAVVGMPVNLVATVSEGNGDVGARADCVLYVDDVEADRARGIWVDAGDAVTCAFTHIFAAAGNPRIRVQVSDVEPADFDPSDNAATGTLRVSEADPGQSDFSYYAQVEDAVMQEVSTYRSHIQIFSPEQTVVDSMIYRTTTRFRSTMFNGWMSRGVSLPLTRVELRQETNGVPIHEATFTDVEGNEYAPVAGPGCTSRWNGRAMIFYLCTFGTPESGHTSFQYLLYATEVTYIGEMHTHIWYAETGGTTYYYNTWTGGSADGEPFFEIGPDYRFSVKVTDGDRTWQTGTRVVMAEMEPYSWSQYAPTGEYCESFSDESQMWNRCWSHQGTKTGRLGVSSHYLEE